MKLLRFSIFFIVSLALAAVAQAQTVIIRAGTLLDGKGHELHNMFIVVIDGKIQGVVPIDKVQWGNNETYDLSHRTVMPGWIDVHDHITWHFGPNGRIEDKSETPYQAALAAAENAYATLMAGFTTIQSVGRPRTRSCARRSQVEGCPDHGF
jgi:imidazolonepropionase-like amidohydrolase